MKKVLIFLFLAAFLLGLVSCDPLTDRIDKETIRKALILYQNDGNMLVLFGCAWQNENGRTKYYGQCCMFDKNGAFVAYLGDISSDYVDTLESRYFEGYA